MGSLKNLIVISAFLSLFAHCAQAQDLRGVLQNQVSKVVFSEPISSAETATASLLRYEGERAEAQTLTRYGYDLYSERSSNRGNFSEVRVRGGIADTGKKAAAGVQLIISW